MQLDRLALYHILLAPAQGDRENSAVGGTASGMSGVSHASLVPPRPIQSNRTDSHDNAAERLWLICRQKNGQHDTPTKEELSERGTKQLTTELCHFITSQPIPIYLDDNLKPTTESNR